MYFFFTYFQWSKRYKLYVFYHASDSLKSPEKVAIYGPRYICICLYLNCILYNRKETKTNNNNKNYKNN